MAPATHSLEADLRAAREAANLTIEDIHQETRLATDILKRFESGQLMSDPTFNAVYLKAFARSYGEAVGLRPHRVEAAMEAVKAGTYRGELHPDYVEGKLDSGKEAQAGAEPVDKAVSVPKPSVFPQVDPLPPATPGGFMTIEVPKTVPYAEARPTRRLQKNVRPSSGASFDTAWGAILGVTVLVVLAVCAILWLLFRSDSPEPDLAAVSEPDTTEARAANGSTSEAAPGQTEAPRLAFPVEVTVVADGDGLQGFRVTELPDERRPIWLETGESETFSSSQGVVLWGEGGLGMNPEEVTLRFRGYEWKPPPGQILRIDSTYGQTLLDSLHNVFPAAGRTTPQS